MKALLFNIRNNINSIAIYSVISALLFIVFFETIGPLFGVSGWLALGIEETKYNFKVLYTVLFTIFNCGAALFIHRLLSAESRSERKFWLIGLLASGAGVAVLTVISFFVFD